MEKIRLTKPRFPPLKIPALATRAIFVATFQPGTADAQTTLTLAATGQAVAVPDEITASLDVQVASAKATIAQL